MGGAERGSGGVRSGCGAGPDGTAGFRFRREVSGRVRSSAPLLAEPSWPLGADGSGVGGRMVMHFPTLWKGHFWLVSGDGCVVIQLTHHSPLTTHYLTLLDWDVPALSPRGRSTWNGWVGRASDWGGGGFGHGCEAAVGPGAHIATRRRARGRWSPGNPLRRSNSNKPLSAAPGVRRGRAWTPVG